MFWVYRVFFMGKKKKRAAALLWWLVFLVVANISVKCLLAAVARGS
jgi:hypothetical protein